MSLRERYGCIDYVWVYGWGMDECVAEMWVMQRCVLSTVWVVYGDGWRMDGVAYVDGWNMGKGWECAPWGCGKGGVPTQGTIEAWRESCYTTTTTTTTLNYTTLHPPTPRYSLPTTCATLHHTTTHLQLTLHNTYLHYKITVHPSTLRHMHCAPPNYSSPPPSCTFILLPSIPLAK